MSSTADWLFSEWSKIGSPTSERPSKRLDAWYRAADAAIPILKQAAQRGDWDNVKSAAKRLRGGISGGFSMAPPRSALSDAIDPIEGVGKWIARLQKIADLILGRVDVDRFHLEVENLYEEDFLDAVSIYPEFAMDRELNESIAAFLDRAVQQDPFSKQTPAEFAALFSEKDSDALERALRLAKSENVRRKAIAAVAFDDITQDIACSIGMVLKNDVNRTARRRVDEEVADQWRNTMRDIWDYMGQRGRLDMFLDIDNDFVPRHPRLPEGTTTDDAVLPGTQLHAGVWESEIIARARSMLEAGDFIKDERMRGVFSARHATKEPLRPEQSLAIASDQVVLLASSPGGQKWVVKYAEGVEGEEENWLRLGEEGGATPDILPGYNIFGLSVLVVERLFRLDRTDDEYEIARQLISTQFPFLHKFAIHADIKPDNVMKRVYKSDTTQGPDYFIIDMDVDDERKGEGFVRNHMTPLFNSAQPGSNLPMTWRGDLLEFLYTLNALALNRQYHSEPKVGPYGPNKFSPLYAAKGFYDSLPGRSAERRLFESELYADPMTRFPQSNTVVWAAVEKQLKVLHTSAVPMGIRRAYAVLEDSPTAHPDDPVTFEPYKLLAKAFDLTPAELSRDRKDFMPVQPMKTAGPFAGAQICWTCARTPKQASVSLFRERAHIQRVFCGNRCQEAFHATPEDCERM